MSIIQSQKTFCKLTENTCGSVMVGVENKKIMICLLLLSIYSFFYVFYFVSKNLHEKQKRKRIRGYEPFIYFL